MIIITGATGHIGNNFARLLASRNIPFKLLVRNVSNSISDFLDHILIGDIFDVVFLSQTVHKGDILVHFAAFIDIYDNRLDESMFVNDFGTRTIIDFCSNNQIRLIYSSSVDIICRTTKQAHIIEPVEIFPELQISNYALTKANSTKYLLGLMDKHLIEATIVYPTAVIGQFDYKPSRAGEEIQSCLHKRLFFYVDGGYNFIDVEDISTYCLELIEKNLSGSFILGAHNIKIHDFYKLINRVRMKRAIYIKIPKWLAMLYGRFSPKYSPVMMKAVFDNYHYDLTKMRETFEHSPIPFETTVKNTISWFLENEHKKK